MSYFVTIKNEATGNHYGINLSTLAEVNALIGSPTKTEKRKYTKRATKNVLKVGKRKVGRPSTKTAKRGPGRPKGYSPKKASAKILSDISSI